MLRIRLRRVGKKKQPMYRIVVADSRAPRDGDFVESIGYYHPLDDPSTIVLDGERARLWLDRGAQPSERVSKLLAIQGIADLPAKLKTRIELGNRRAKEAAAEKAQRKAEAPAEEAPVAETAAVEEQPEASTEEAPAEDAPATEAGVVEEKPETPAEEAPAPEAAVEEEKPETPTQEAPAAEATAEEEQPAEPEATAEQASSDEEEKSEA